MNQLDLPLARRTDPVTSHAAADRVPEFRASHEGMIFGALSECGYRGGTIKELERLTNLDRVQIARRLKGMERRQLVKRKLVLPMPTDLHTEYEHRNGCCVWFVSTPA